jgi:hypothetical protein
MSDSYGYQLDRGLLGPAGQALSEDEYVQVIAGIGTRSIPPPPDPRATWGRDGAWFPMFQSELTRGTFLEGPAPGQLNRALANDLIGVWRNWVRSHPIAITEAWRMKPGQEIGLPLLAVAAALSHPAVEAESVTLEWQSPQLDLNWQWPLRIQALDDDLEALELETLTRIWPAERLSRVRAVSRDAARSEILVVRGAPRDALRRLLGLAHRVRTGLLVLVAPLDTPWEDMGAHLDALLAETQAGGLAIVQSHPALGWSDRINGLVERLSHNMPIDVAIGEAFAPGLCMQFIDERLRTAPDLNTAAQMVGARVAMAPPALDVPVPVDALERTGVVWRPGMSGASLGSEITTLATTRSLRFDAESGGATVVTALERAARRADRTAAEAEQPRHLQGRVFRKPAAAQDSLPEEIAFVVGQEHALETFIGAIEQGALVANEPIPEDALDWRDKKTISLQVLLTEPNQWPEPLRGTLELPRRGKSSTHRFVFTPTKPGPFSGRVTLYYRGRVLQTALLEGVVARSADDMEKWRKAESRIAMRVEAEVRRALSNVDERSRFDACIVCNHTAAHKAALTAAGKNGAFVASLGNTHQALASISQLLTDVALDVEKYSGKLNSKANAQLLGNLAAEGNSLYRYLVKDYIQRSSAAEELQKAEYLQIVTMEPDAIVPLEFVYEYALPDDGAPVCKNAGKALASGKCPDTCKPLRGTAPHVCPMGFWGLSKVIERHIHVPELAKAAKVVSEPIKGRDVLSIRGRTLLGLSNQVTAPDDANLMAAVTKVRKSGVVTAKTWVDWTKAIAKSKPTLLVALPHAEGTGANITLEIGGDTIQSRRIDESYVRAESAPPPLTILFGCDTTNTADTESYLHHVGVFRQADAALVLGTVATVFAPHASTVTGELLKRLEKAAKAPRRFGEVLRDTKRAAVKDGMMMALCLVAFGDADWKIVSKRGAQS